MDVSAIIVTYKRDDLLRDCLASLSAVCKEGEVETVVVDNAPLSGAARSIAQEYGAIYVASPCNSGFAGGNNIALRHCTRKYILLLNNDTIVHSRESIAALEQFLSTHPRCGAAQGTMHLPAAGDTLGGCGSFLAPLGILVTRKIFVPPAQDDPDPVKVFHGIGAFLMVRREVLAHTGGLFRTHFWAYYEEVDFCHRLWLSGYEVWYVPTPPIDHLMGATSNSFNRSAIMGRYLRNQFFSLRANLSFASRLRILPFYVLIIAGHAALHLLRGDVKMAAADCRVLFFSRRDRIRLKAARRQIARIRKVPDSAFLPQISRMPSLAYFFRSLAANS
ncbi:MAG: glycosyltransferase family 2 protein [Kiritimatiellae bacterium]|nr:glycosyltransferase family 2 protein [Kiritimatiellia bacterium]